MYVYAIGTTDNRQKIGITHDLKERLSALQTGNPETLTIHGAIEVPDHRARIIEKKIHHELSHKRLKGEWFRMSAKEATDTLIFAEIRWVDDPLLT